MRWIRRILVPVTFSAGSRAAYEYARFLAANVGATVDVLHAAASGGDTGPRRMGGAGGALRVRGFLGAGNDVDVIPTAGDLARACILATHGSYDVVVVDGSDPIHAVVREAAGCRVVTTWPPPQDSPVPFALEPDWSEPNTCGTAAEEAVWTVG